MFYRPTPRTWWIESPTGVLIKAGEDQPLTGPGRR